MRALLLLGLAAAPLRAQAPRPVTLDEAFRLAEARSEDLAARAEGIREADARIDELKGAVQPSLALVRTDRFQEDAGSGGTGVQGTFNDPHRPEMRLAARQPLFAGFRELLALKAARKQGEAARLDLRDARSALYLDVARAWADLSAVQRETTSRRAVLKLTTDRVRELKERERVGRSRPTEVLAAESLLARSEARLEELTGEDAAAQEVLRFLTGLSGPVSAADAAEPPLPGLEAAVAASASHPKVLASRLSLEALDFLSRSARRERWPVIGLDANWYLQRPGFQEDIRWDAALTASLPLYSGGQASARMGQADARRRAAEQDVAAAARRAEAAARTAWTDLDAALRAVRANERAAELADRNAVAQAEDYRHGLVTNLEVLGALDDAAGSRLALESARVRAVLAAARLNAATGGPK